MLETLMVLESSQTLFFLVSPRVIFCTQTEFSFELLRLFDAGRVRSPKIKKILQIIGKESVSFHSHFPEIFLEVSVITDQ